MSVPVKNTVCMSDGCKDKAVCRQLCWKHYQRLISEKKSSGEWDSIKRGFRKSCSVAGCQNKHFADGLCQRHYTQAVKRRNRHFIMERYFPNGVVCGKCGKSFELVQMDAHHPNPEVKEHTLSVLLNNSALQERPRLVAELDQCGFLCCRCHQNLHHDPVTTHEETYQRKDKGRRIDEMKKIVRQLFGEKCVSCGDWLYPKEMEFHHKDSEQKVDNVSDLMRIVSREEVIQEVSKCDIICRNCHRLRIEKAA